MYEANTLPIPKRAEKIFLFMLSFYPKQHRKRFGEEMALVFEDLCREQLEKHQKLTGNFWAQAVADLTKSIVEEHIHEVRQNGMKKYLKNTFSINKYNVVSILLLLPVLLMTGTEIVSRVVQRDLVHYNRPVYAFFSHTFLYWTPVLFTWVILFPLLAALISLIPLVKACRKKKAAVYSWTFLRKHFLGIIILFFGLGFIALIRLHDFVPCLFYGITHFGFGQVGHILSVCTNA